MTEDELELAFLEAVGKCLQERQSRLDPETVRASAVLSPNQGRTESPLLRSGEVFQQTARAYFG